MDIVRHFRKTSISFERIEMASFLQRIIKVVPTSAAKCLNWSLGSPKSCGPRQAVVQSRRSNPSAGVVVAVIVVDVLVITVSVAFEVVYSGDFGWNLVGRN